MIPSELYMVVYRVKATDKRPAGEWRRANIAPFSERHLAVGAAQNRISQPIWSDTEYAVVQYSLAPQEGELEVIEKRPRVTKAPTVHHKGARRFEDDEDND